MISLLMATLCAGPREILSREAFEIEFAIVELHGVIVIDQKWVGERPRAVAEQPHGPAKVLGFVPVADCGHDLLKLDFLVSGYFDRFEEVDMDR